MVTYLLTADWKQPVQPINFKGSEIIVNDTSNAAIVYDTNCVIKGTGVYENQNIINSGRAISLSKRYKYECIKSRYEKDHLL
jgi:hypothetical protein